MLGKNRFFSIGEHFSGFIEARVNEGRYSSASDVIRAALIEGEQSGSSTPFNFEAFIARKRATSTA